MTLHALCTAEKDKCCSGYIVELAGQWGVDPAKLQFDWTLSGGQIVEGDKTTTTRIHANGNSRKTVEIKVKVSGLDSWPDGCQREITLTVDCCRDRSKFSYT
jgi:hypothetical protein